MSSDVKIHLCLFAGAFKLAHNDRVLPKAGYSLLVQPGTEVQ